jgi:hypothetical protein
MKAGPAWSIQRDVEQAQGVLAFFLAASDSTRSPDVGHGLDPAQNHRAEVSKNR